MAVVERESALLRAQIVGSRRYVFQPNTPRTGRATRHAGVPLACRALLRIRVGDDLEQRATTRVWLTSKYQARCRRGVPGDESASWRHSV